MHAKLIWLENNLISVRNDAKLKRKRRLNYMLDFNGNVHQYYLYSTGTGLKPNTFYTRKAAEIAMQEYCAKHGISVECTECDKHERKYSNHNGVRFYINRI